MSISVGSYEAKTNLPRLLDRVALGETVTITKHGHPVAQLVPVDADTARAADVIAALRQARTESRLGATDVRELIDEGRR